MEISELPLAGALLLQSSPHADDRGYFMRTFDAALGRAHGIDLGPDGQDSVSRSEDGVLRGLHGRTGRGEAKLVRCLQGAVLDVVVDARPTSPTFGRHEAVELSEDNHRALWIPRGFLHGFQVLDGPALVAYRIDTPHDPAEDVGVHHADPALGIAWRGTPQVVSERDRALGSWAELVATLEALG